MTRSLLRLPRPLLVLLVILAGVFALPFGTTLLGAQDTDLTSQELDGAVVTLEIQQEVDRRMLLSDRQRYSDLLRRRREITGRLETLYTRLDQLYERLIRGEVSAEEAMELQQQLAELETSLDRAETERDRIREESWLLRAGMREKGLRLTLRGSRLDALRAASVSRRGALTGRWRVDLQPVNQEGRFVLRQEGTLLSGRYSIGTDRQGSFEGTVVGNQITLQQVDAKYGKDAVFYGSLVNQGIIEGTWESLSFGTGRPSFGTWRAVRVPEEGEEQPDEPPLDPDRRTPLPSSP